MSDNKQKRGTPDRSKVAGGENYEVKYLANKLDTTQKLVKEAIKEVGTNRVKVTAYIKKNK